MQLNLEKFQTIAVGKHTHTHARTHARTHTHTHTLEMHPAPNFGSVNITCEEVIKLLGVDIDSHFCFVQFLIFVHWHGTSALKIILKDGEITRKGTKVCL